MAELFLELFGEEIPARMQARAADDLARLVGEALAALSPSGVQTFHGPRRIALRADVAAVGAASSAPERGPRAAAPEQALAGFLRKHGASREQLRVEGDFYVLDKASQAAPAAGLIASAMPALLRRFPWPKSMRWGGTSAFTWVRPLRRIVCLLDGRVVPFDLRDGADDGHGLASSNLTEGHRFHAPGAFAVEGAADWEARLRDRRVIVRAEERRAAIADGAARLAGERGLSVVDDPGLLDEVAGLVEWPVPLLGRIGEEFMDLPPEVMQVSMRVNQRYFALRNPDGSAAPWFAFAANIEADDGGAAIVAGNERVLRARFSDARHFWDLDRKTKLADRVAALDGIVFHAKLGSQGDRVRRLMKLAGVIAPYFGADQALAERAALLAKADLTTGMVGEFPELQGVMGGYYAAHDGETEEVCAAIRWQYAAISGPHGARSLDALRLADRLDQLAQLFNVGERPTGSGDPFALRRAALGIITLLLGTDYRVALRALLAAAGSNNPEEVFGFILERWRVLLRGRGERHDVLEAVQAARRSDDLVMMRNQVGVAGGFLNTFEGKDLLSAYRRAANILRIEDKKDGPHAPAPDSSLLILPEERALAASLDAAGPVIAATLKAENYSAALTEMAALRAPLDAFFERVTVNAPEPELRLNRLALLSKIRSVMDQVADFSKIEGTST